KYDYVIFDCPPATKLVSQNALAASEYFVIPVIPDELSSRGVTHFRELVRQKIDGKLEFLRQAAGVADPDCPKSYVKQTKLAGIAPFMAKRSPNAASGLTNVHTEQLAALRRAWGSDLLDTVVMSLTGVPESMTAGWPVWDHNVPNVTRQVKKMMRDVCMEIESRLV
ncbi:AAA family ATPase, partial [Nostoc sp. NIES-2111]